MGHLNLAFLGTPLVRHNGQVLAFRTRKALGLLIYLAVAGGTHPREKLTALSWPDSDEEQGRASLRNALMYLRTALQETADSPHLIIEREALGFDFRSEFELDISTLQIAFKQAYARSNVEGLQGNLRQSLLSQLQAAVEQYRGDFLDGFGLDDAPDFDDWVRRERATWHQRMSTVLDRLSQVQFNGGEVADAIETLTRWAAHDPLNEAVYQRLMRVHFAAGDRNAALAAYETCRSVLAKELRAQPAQETKALAERIRAKTPIRTATSSRPAHPAALPGVPLIGRGAEYGSLIAAYHAASASQTQVVLLTGEAGIGKTRLASEFLGWTAAHGADVLQGRAFETGGQLPYQALVDALRGRIERENAPEDLLSDPWLAELSRLLPELSERYPDLPSPAADEATARLRLFESVVRLFQALAEREPIVLFMDDMHWADIATLDILHYAARRWQESKTPLLLLASMRPGTFARESALGSWLASLEHNLQPTRLELGPLTGEDTARFVGVLAQEGSESRDIEQVGRWLFGETRGQPFYMMEMLKALLEQGLLVPRPEEHGAWGIDFKAVVTAETSLRGLLPPGVRQVIRSRLTQLPPGAFTLLAAGAVLGHDFSFEQVRQVAGMPEHEGLLALDELLKSQHFSESDGHEQDSYAFTHDKIRDVAYTEAGEARRRIFHRRALVVLEAGAAPPAELARHARAAGLGEPAFRWSVAAGDEAMRLFAVRDAIAQYEQARHLLAEQQGRDNFSTPAIEHLYVQTGRAYELNSEFEQAQAVYQEMLAYARAAGRAGMECVALNHLATLSAQNPYDYEHTIELLHQALDAASQSGDPALLAETEWNLAQLYFYHFEPVRALQHGERALAFAQQVEQHADTHLSASARQLSVGPAGGKEELLARSLNVLAYAHMVAGHREESATSAEEARALYAALGNRAMEADSLCLVAVNSINCGRLQEAIGTARRAYSISHEIENAWGQVNSALPLGQGLLEMGAYSEALALAESAVKLARSAGMTILLYLSLILLGTVQRAMLSLEAARAAHLQALAMAGPSGVQLLTEVVAAELCADCALAGDWEEAHTYALQALKERTDTFLLSTKLTLWYETEALVRAGEIERADEDIQRFGEYIGSSPRYRIPYLRALAVLAQARGETGEAIEYLQEAAHLAEEIGLPGELWPIQVALRDLYLSQGEKEQAQSASRQAAVLVRKLAEAIESDELRANFLASPLVQRLFDTGYF